MIIGIDASRAFVKHRTGIEEYAYQVIKHLIPLLIKDQVILYARKNSHFSSLISHFPSNWKIKVIKWPYLWTQLGLSLEMIFHPVDVLFVPAHTVPIIHPRNTIVTIHGLEYEFCPQAYSFWERFYMRRVIKNSCQWAKKIIAVSENTKKDLMRLYKVPEGKVEVAYEGYEKNHVIASGAKQSHNDTDIEIKKEIAAATSFPRNDSSEKFLLFIGRLEERKNIIGIIKAFEILKEQYKLPHKLVLAGNFGYGKEKIVAEIKNNNYSADIILPGYVSEEEKWELLKNADVFLFPTFYEGFGLPILEAQSAGVPVVAGNNSSVPEIVNIKCHSGLDPESNQKNKDFLLDSRLRGNDKEILKQVQDDKLSVILVNPNNAEEIADAAQKLVSDKVLRDDIIKRGYENVKRFSWEKCANSIAKLLNG